MFHMTTKTDCKPLSKLNTNFIYKVHLDEPICFGFYTRPQNSFLICSNCTESLMCRLKLQYLIKHNIIIKRKGYRTLVTYDLKVPFTIKTDALEELWNLYLRYSDKGSSYIRGLITGDFYLLKEKAEKLSEELIRILTDTKNLQALPYDDLER
jgi:hypothetical protein